MKLSNEPGEVNEEEMSRLPNCADCRFNVETNKEGILDYDGINRGVMHSSRNECRQGPPSIVSGWGGPAGWLRIYKSQKGCFQFEKIEED